MPTVRPVTSRLRPRPLALASRRDVNTDWCCTLYRLAQRNSLQEKQKQPHTLVLGRLEPLCFLPDVLAVCLSECLSVSQGSICGYTVVTGGAARLVFGYDSYGNTCGRRNEQIEGIWLSGLDHTDRR